MVIAEITTGNRKYFIDHMILVYILFVWYLSVCSVFDKENILPTYVSEKLVYFSHETFVLCICICIVSVFLIRKTANSFCIALHRASCLHSDLSFCLIRLIVTWLLIRSLGLSNHWLLDMWNKT